ncbi:MAG: ferritin-like domain-containing protein [Shimia sp.]
MADRIDALKTLLTRLVDSRKGYEEVIDDLDAPHLKALAQSFLDRRARNAAQIREYLTRAGHEADEDGSLLASAHRTFTGLKNSLSSGDEAVLAETIRGEKQLLDAYDQAIEATGGTDPEYAWLVTQYEELKTEVAQLETRKDLAAE